MPKNPLQDPVMKAMQTGLMKAKKTTKMKPPPARPRAKMDFAKKVM